MKDTDIIRRLNSDTLLYEAISRREQKLPSISADLNDRLMQRINHQAERPKFHRIWLYPAIGVVAACIVLLLIFHKQHAELPIQQPQCISRTNEMLVWQYEKEQTRLDIFFAHQQEVQEKGKRLAAHIQQQTDIDIENKIKWKQRTSY